MSPGKRQPSPSPSTNGNRSGQARLALVCTNHNRHFFSISSFGAKRRFGHHWSGRGCPPSMRWAGLDRGSSAWQPGEAFRGGGTHAPPWRGRDWTAWERWFVQFVLREFTTPCAKRPALGRLFSSFCTISPLVPQSGTPNREPGTDLNTSFCRKRATSPTFRSWVATLLDGPTRPPTFTLPFAAPGCTHCPHLP